MALIETDRLILRPFDMTDLEAWSRILADPATTSSWPAPFPPGAAREWIQLNSSIFADYGIGRLAVILKETEQLIGDCGITRLELDEKLENDLGYIIHAPHWHRGYATEAAIACKDYGFEKLNLQRICSNMPADFTAARRVAERVGMRLEKEFENRRNRNILTCLYAIEQPVDD